MGEALQIRVSAVTWNEDLVEKLWPRLTQLAASVPTKQDKHGVLEMVRALSDGLAFMDWSPARKEKMGPLIRKAAEIKASLEKALADWKPAEANAASEQLEATLDELEKSFTK